MSILRLKGKGGMRNIKNRNWNLTMGLVISSLINTFLSSILSVHAFDFIHNLELLFAKTLNK